MPKSTKRVLIYNWVQFDNPDRLGGGVSVYLKNLIGALSERNDIEIVFLSSGVHDTGLGLRVTWRETENILSEHGVRTFEILNAPVKAPAHRMFHDIGTASADRRTRRALAKFMRAFGPFDAVHFHNLEGISSQVLTLKPEFPETRFCFTWHNYGPLCPQVQLLFKEQEDCRDFDKGRNCVVCLDREMPRRRRPVLSRLVGKGTGDAASYRSWRDGNLALFNEVIDSNIAVSEIVRNTIVSLGIREQKVAVVPLGMDVHVYSGDMKAAWTAKPRHDVFTFSFLGYGTPDKGLPFLADALERCHDGFLKTRADLIVAAHLTEQQGALAARLESHFRKVTCVDGYRRDQLPEIAKRVDVNIVPSIWRETFNQVGYELLCTGTPCLLASRVGLGMFYRNKEAFVFETGNHADLIGKMVALVRKPDNLAAFWETPVDLPDMKTHTDAVLKHVLGIQ